MVPGYQFASDNTSGVCPEALTALVEANVGEAAPYGEDRFTAEVADRLREIFETDCEVFFVFNGTAANSLAISTCCLPYHSVICGDVAHLETDECGGPEFFSGGAKILLARTDLGRLRAKSVRELATRRTDIHYPKPRLLSVTQPTELGTLYSVDELTELTDTARQLGMRVHMDGARFANAVAASGKSPAELTWKVGIDVLCLGGAKMGLPCGEAVVFFDRELASEFAYRCKQSGQLAAKMRFLTAPWLGVLDDGTWLRHASHANDMARRLAEGLEQVPGARLLYPAEVNAVFASLPAQVHTELAAKGWKYYTFIGEGGARFMCSWATTPVHVDALLADLQSATPLDTLTGDNSG